MNVLGCLAMGILFVLFTERFADSEALRAGVLIGVLGGFTTFSSLSIDALNLIDQGETTKAGLYVAGTALLCIVATWGGVLLGRQL